MSRHGANFWTDDTSVLFTSFWGWSPETWATVGWSNDRGRTYRDRLLTKLTDPFIAVIYVTRDPERQDVELIGKVAGFYLMSHQTGDRNEFTHPSFWQRYPEKWRHSVRALRAFTYLAAPSLIAKEVEPDIRTGAAQAIASWGKVLTDQSQISLLRRTPWREEAIYRPGLPSDVLEDVVPAGGMVPAGPIAMRPYAVSPNASIMGWRLYLLRLDGDTGAYLGEPAKGRFIYKIGLSVSPEVRRRTLQKALPLGAFRWRTERSSESDQKGMAFTFEAAIAGENAMKLYLAEQSRWLGGEFYLATTAQIDKAWRRGHAAASTFCQRTGL
jgi:hypothetical protein